MRVLIVEDEVRLAATLQDLLEMQGYSADVSHDGESGLDNALSAIYDVIILDVMLPKLNGFDVLRRLRAEGNTTPVLMLTARSEVTDKVQGLDSGADYYLTKPFEPKEPPDAGDAGDGPADLRRSPAGAEHLQPLLRGAVRAPEPEGVRHDGAADAQPEAGDSQGKAAAEGVGL